VSVAIPQRPLHPLRRRARLGIKAVFEGDEPVADGLGRGRAHTPHVEVEAGQLEALSFRGLVKGGKPRLSLRHRRLPRKSLPPPPPNPPPPPHPLPPALLPPALRPLPSGLPRPRCEHVGCRPGHATPRHPPRPHRHDNPVLRRRRRLRWPLGRTPPQSTAPKT